MRTTTLSVWSLALILTINTTGCLGPSPQVTFDSGSSSNAGGTSYGVKGDGLSGSGEYSCPAYPNVLPDYDWHRDGTGQFQVCVGRDDPSKLEIHGTLLASNTICIYPLMEFDSGELKPFQGEEGSGLLHHCVKAGSEGVFDSFPGTDFNAVFIVEEPWKFNFELCIAGPEGPNYMVCPGVTAPDENRELGYFSYGRIR